LFGKTHEGFQEEEWETEKGYTPIALHENKSDPRILAALYG
jgi:hypothetical protein